MKVWKSIGYLFLYPVLLLGTGFLGGALFVSTFYPDKISSEKESYAERTVSTEERDMMQPESQESESDSTRDRTEDSSLMTADNNSVGSAERLTESPAGEEILQQVVNEMGEVLNADTSYVLEETDLRSNSVVETTWNLPTKYIGMDRQEFLEAMEVYEASPPLAELERGFVSLEVLSFSAEEVVVQMNYEYVLPTASFYLMVRDNYVVVCLEDMRTVYMETDILLKDLPDELQQDIIQMMYVPDEESLYDFLENYSS